MTKGILLNARNHASVPRDEYDDWYQDEHLPERSRVPGFLTAERWVDVNDPNVSVAVYDLASVDVLGSAAYRAVGYDNLSPWTRRVARLSERLLRFEGTQTLPGDAPSPSGSGALLVNAMNAAPEGEAEFNRWYDEEHIPALSAVPGTLLARRFRATATSKQWHLALYHLESPDMVATEAWAKAVATPWTQRIRPFMRDRLRIVCRPYRQLD
ncbi:MAG: hypothetical protein GEV05_30395 [Betaproteobacteria bacterium]|nr:hypothetical protein [Betaproteobacteria bacterium]